LPRFVELSLVSEVLGISSSLLSPSDLLLRVLPLRVELSNGLWCLGLGIISGSLLLFSSRCITLGENLPPDTVGNVVEGGSSLGPISVSSGFINGRFKNLHFLGSLLSIATPGAVRLVNSSDEESLKSTISIGRDVTLVVVVVLGSVRRSRTISLPWLNVDGILNNIADSGANRVSTLSISAGDVRLLVNEFTVRKLSSNVDELGFFSLSRSRGNLGGLLLLFSLLFLFDLLLLLSISSRGSSSGLLLLLGRESLFFGKKEALLGGGLITSISRIVLRVMSRGSTTSLPRLDINSVLDDLANS
jgi:hypothetical protein